jgi:hypothetical protein
MCAQLKTYKEGSVRSTVDLQLNMAFINRPQKANAVKTKLTRKADNAVAYQLQDTVDIVPLVKLRQKINK